MRHLDQVGASPRQSGAGQTQRAGFVTIGVFARALRVRVLVRVSRSRAESKTGPQLFPQKPKPTPVVIAAVQRPANSPAPPWGLPPITQRGVQTLSLLRVQGSPLGARLAAGQLGCPQARFASAKQLDRPSGRTYTKCSGRRRRRRPDPSGGRRPERWPRAASPGRGGEGPAAGPEARAPDPRQGVLLLTQSEWMTIPKHPFSPPGQGGKMGGRPAPDGADSSRRARRPGPEHPARSLVGKAVGYGLFCGQVPTIFARSASVFGTAYRACDRDPLTIYRILTPRIIGVP